MDSKNKGNPAAHIVLYILSVVAAAAILIYGFAGERLPKPGAAFDRENFERYVEIGGGNFGAGSYTEMFFTVSVENVSKFELRGVTVCGTWNGATKSCDVGTLRVGQMVKCEFKFKHAVGEVPDVEYWAEGEIA